MTTTEQNIEPISTEVLIRHVLPDGSVIEQAFTTGDAVPMPRPCSCSAEPSAPPEKRIDDGGPGPREGVTYAITNRGAVSIIGFDASHRPTNREVARSLPFVGHIGMLVGMLLDRPMSPREIGMAVSFHPLWKWAGMTEQTVKALHTHPVTWTVSGTTEGWSTQTRSIAKLEVLAKILEEMAAR